MSHGQSSGTRDKIGSAVRSSSWRRKAGDKSQEAPSVAGTWDEDFSTPSKYWRRARFLDETDKEGWS